jgi:hypothetical protein
VTPAPVAPKEQKSTPKPDSTQTIVKGRMGTRNVPKTVPVSVVTPTGSGKGKLPLTGFDVLFQVFLGGLVLAGGATLYRRTSLA